MLTARRSLTLHADSGQELPRVPAFQSLYAAGVRPRFGQVIMVAGRSGSQKSGFAMFWVDEMDLPTLYFSGDMSPSTASGRIASKRSGLTTEELDDARDRGGQRWQDVLDATEGSKVQFSFGSPIKWESVDQEIEAWVELHNSYPSVIVFDNLMDFEGAESDYTEQMSVMQLVTELARETGATVIIMHHASDKSWDAKNDPWAPPSRDQVKGGLSEKPELSLSVALDPNDLSFRVACIKQRQGPQDPTARRYSVLRCEPSKTRFHVFTPNTAWS